jgi:hypothetical protein
VPERRKTVCLIDEICIIDYNSVKPRSSSVHRVLSEREASTKDDVSLVQGLLNPLLD